MLLRYKIN